MGKLQAGGSKARHAAEPAIFQGRKALKAFQVGTLLSEEPRERSFQAWNEASSLTVPEVRGLNASEQPISQHQPCRQNPFEVTVRNVVNRVCRKNQGLHGLLFSIVR